MGAGSNLNDFGPGPNYRPIRILSIVCCSCGYLFSQKILNDQLNLRYVCGPQRGPRFVPGSSLPSSISCVIGEGPDQYSVQVVRKCCEQTRMGAIPRPFPVTCSKFCVSLTNRTQLCRWGLKTTALPEI